MIPLCAILRDTPPVYGDDGRVDAFSTRLAERDATRAADLLDDVPRVLRGLLNYEPDARAEAIEWLGRAEA